MNKLKIFLIVILCSFFSFPANSHQISQSFSNWTVEEKNITAVFSVAPRYITLLPVLDGYYDSLEDQLSNHLKKNIKIFFKMIGFVLVIYLSFLNQDLLKLLIIAMRVRL